MGSGRRSAAVHFGEKEVPHVLGIRVGLGHHGWRFERLRGYWGNWSVGIEAKMRIERSAAVYFCEYILGTGAGLGSYENAVRHQLAGL
jgi:hypothetical protein